MFVRRVFNLSVKPRHGGQLYCCQVPPDNNFAMSDVSFDNAASSFMCGSEVFAYFCLNGATTIDDCLNYTASTTAGRISNPSM